MCVYSLGNSTQQKRGSCILVAPMCSATLSGNFKHLLVYRKTPQVGVTAVTTRVCLEVSGISPHVVIVMCMCIVCGMQLQLCSKLPRPQVCWMRLLGYQESMNNP